MIKDEKKGLYLKHSQAFVKMLKIVANKCNMTMTEIVEYSVLDFVKKGDKLNLFRSYALSQEQKGLMQLFEHTQKQKVTQALSIDNFEKTIHDLMKKGVNNEMIKEICILEIMKIELTYDKKIRQDYLKQAYFIIQKYFHHLVSNIKTETKRRLNAHKFDTQVLDGDELLDGYRTADDYIKTIEKKKQQQFITDK